jgi:hypothetical protein
MAEQTVAEKLEEVYRIQLQLQEERIKELNGSHEKALHLEREEHHEQRKIAAHAFEERRQELIHQNDGMLGAIGRLHSESESLKGELSKWKSLAMEAQEKLDRSKADAEVMVEQFHAKYEAAIDQERRESALRVKDLERQLAAAKGKPAKGKKA